MIVYCRACKQDTIVTDRVGGYCSFCDLVLVTACPACGKRVYPEKRVGRPHTRCTKHRTHHQKEPA